MCLVTSRDQPLTVLKATMRTGLLPLHEVANKSLAVRQFEVQTLTVFMPASASVGDA
jgi:hypothetical protein